MTDYIKCDICNKQITDFNELSHITAILDGELNTHIHICLECYNNSGIEITYLTSYKK